MKNMLLSADKQALLVKTLFLLVVFTSCNSEKNKISRKVSDKKVIKLELEGPYEKIKMSNVFESDFEVIKLETIKESLFGQITDMQITDDYIFISDYTTDRFSIFHRNGQFKKALKAAGKGPGEYAKLLDFCLNQKDSLIYIYDDLQKKIITYDYDLNFKEEKRIPFFARHISHLDNGNFAFFTGLTPRQESDYQYELLIVNQNMKIIKTYLPYPDFHNAIRGYTGALKRNYDNNYLYWNCFDNSVFQIDSENTITEKYRITAYNKSILPSYDFYSERRDLSSSDVADEIWEKKLIYSQEFVESKNNLLMFYYADGVKASIINKNTGKQRHSKTLTDDFGLCLNANKRIKPIYMENGICIYAVYYQFYEAMKNNRLHPIFKKFSMNDNPILIIFRLR